MGVAQGGKRRRFPFHALSDLDPNTEPLAWCRRDAPLGPRAQAPNGLAQKDSRGTQNAPKRFGGHSVNTEVVGIHLFARRC